ncbi:MAG: hypothetical protein AMK71_01885 [Nitrospira bacterium SG8_35_4]|nr:MAG: hypothetical protein AMK71_01885 [Nitrospira bacterium SG8_35_4]
MSDLVLAESLYIRRRKAMMGSGGTSKETVLESTWFPYRIDNGFVEVFPVTDDLTRVLQLKEIVPFEQFKQEYSVRENSRDIYLRFKETLP